MDVMQRRRALMENQSRMPKDRLKYWFSGQDAPVNGAWQDRVSNLRFELYKNSSTSGADSLWNQEQGWYEFDGAIGNYAYLADMNAVNLNFGHHWRLEFDLELNGAETKSAFLDFGSVTYAEKAIGFSLVSTNGVHPGRMNVNWKMLGNDSNPGLNINSPYPISDDNIYKPYSGYYAMLDGGDGYDRLHILLNNNASDVAQRRVPKVEYGPTWNRVGAYMGRGFLGGPDYSSMVRIKDLKIYVID